MQKASLLDVFDVEDDIPVTSTAGSRDDVFVEGEGDEDDDDEEVDGGADGAHALGELGAVMLGEVAALEAGADEDGAKPADHGVGEREGQDGEGEGGDQGLAIAGEGVEKDRDGREGEGGEGEGFGPGEGWRRGGGGHVCGWFVQARARQAARLVGSLVVSRFMLPVVQYLSVIGLGFVTHRWDSLCVVCVCVNWCVVVGEALTKGVTSGHSCRRLFFFFLGRGRRIWRRGLRSLHWSVALP